MKRPNLTADPVGPTLVKLVVPMLAGALGIVMFNVVDSFFVGRLGALELAAMSYTFPIVIVAGGIDQPGAADLHGGGDAPGFALRADSGCRFWRGYAA